MPGYLGDLDEILRHFDGELKELITGIMICDPKLAPRRRDVSWNKHLHGMLPVGFIGEQTRASL